MVREALVGVDLGTTYCKAGVIDLDGNELAHARVRTPWEIVPTGAEIHPRRFVEIAQEAVQRALTQAGNPRVLGVGLTSMAETGVLLDQRGEPLAPAIAWHDQRGDPQAAELAQVFGRDSFTLQTGLPPSRLCSLAKLRWLTQNRPELLRAWKWLNVSEWVAFSWGAEPVAELSLATRTGFLRLREKTWWDDPVSWLGFSPSLLPPLVAAGTKIGTVRPGVFPGADNAVLAIGGHDHPCAAVGAGVVHPQQLLDSNGTAEALVRAVPPSLSDDQILQANRGGITIGWHAVPDAWSLLGGVLGGKALQRFVHLLGYTEEKRAQLDALALSLHPGEKLPEVRGVIADTADLLGIGWNMGPGHVWRAAHEALAREVWKLRKLMEQVAGPVEQMVAIGGWTRSELVRHVKQRVFGEVAYLPIEEPGVRGAALLAGLAAGVYPDFWALPSVQVR
ncbi:MAG: FGGY-family carbohydrate kinase [Thermomicrobium sp.]